MRERRAYVLVTVSATSKSKTKPDGSGANLVGFSRIKCLDDVHGLLKLLAIAGWAVSYGIVR